MRFSVITLFPEMLEAVTRFGITGRAVKQGLIEVEACNPRDFTRDKHRTVDDRPYGGGPGMVMLAAPLMAAIKSVIDTASDKPRVIHLSPQGTRLDQAAVLKMAKQTHLVLLAGRYEGIDERLIDTMVDEEWSIGDYVLSGGELAAMVMIDAITRVLPGALGDEQSAVNDSFFGGLLDFPHYTRPEDIKGYHVPEVLMSGDHKAIRRWRLKQALGRTWLRRPELIEALPLNEEQQVLLDEFKREHNRQLGED